MPLILTEKISSNIMISLMYAEYFLLMNSVNRFATLMSFAVKQSIMSYSTVEHAGGLDENTKVFP